MSVERAVVVRLPAATPGLAQLIRDIRSAEKRIAVADPGDRVDVIRYEALCTLLERLAHQHRADGAQVATLLLAPKQGPSFFTVADAPLLPAMVRPWLEVGDVVIELRLPFGPGATPTPPIGELRPPADVWQALDEQGNELDGTPAVAARFREELGAAVNGQPGAVLAPSDVANRVLTEGLRRFVGSTKQDMRVDVPVLYRDGSAGPAFPMRCLRWGRLPAGWREYRFAMLSIRHTEMDVEVDGAWLRNADISKPRPMGDTDRLAFEKSLTQFAALTRTEPALVYLYQTGLEPALVGIYRAVVMQLLERPGSLAVVPRYFRRQPDDAAGPTVAGYRQQATFAKGKPWIA